MAAPSPASSTVAKEETAATASYTISKPSGVAVGDVLYIIATSDGTIETISTPSGFTYEGSKVGTTAGCQMYLFSRRADGSEGSTFTITHSSSTRYKNAICVRVSGVDAGISDLTHVFDSLDDTGTGTGHTSPSVTTTENDCLVLSAFVSDSTNSTAMAPAGSESEVNEVHNASFNGMNLAVYATTKTSPGAVTHSITETGSGAAVVSMTWAIQSGGGGGGGTKHARTLVGVGK